VLKVPWENKLNHGKVAHWYLKILQNEWEYEGMEGLGFSTDAAPPWIASAQFWKDRTGGILGVASILNRILDIMAEVTLPNT